MEITENRIKNITKRNQVFSTPLRRGERQGGPFAAPLVRGVKLGFFALNLNMTKTVTTALLLLVCLTSIFLLTAPQAIAKGPSQPSNPQPIGTIDPVTVNVGDSAVDRNVSENFIDYKDLENLTYTAKSSDTAVATVSVSGAVVTITPVAAGSTTVTVTATDSDNLTGTQDIAVKVNGAPTASGTIDAVTVYVGGNATTVDVSSKFSDPNSDTLSYTAASSDTDVATVSVSEANVSITPVAVGTATVTVTASDGSLTGTQTIAVTVPNRAPTAVGTIAPVTVNLGSGATDVDVSSKFVDSDSHTLTYTAVSSDTSKATANVSGAVIKITGVAVGTATVTVTANDSNGGTATQTIAVTVPNRAPTKVGTIDAVTLTAGGSTADVNVSSKFSDPDGQTLTYTAVSSDTSKATVSVSGAVVTIAPRASGTATVTVTANDGNGGTATQTITARVSNRAPTRVGTIDPVTLTGAGSTTNVNVSGKFLDPDSDTLSYTAVSSDTTKATVSVSSFVVTITSVAAGTATVTVTASDGSLTATQTIAVTVQQSNRAPTTVGTIAPVTLIAAGSATDVDVSGKFSDPDSNTLSYTAVSSDTTKATVSVSNFVVTITPVAVGTSTVTVTASDGSLTATQTIAVTVKQSNRAPTRVGTINPVTVTVAGSAANVNVSGNFSDPDNDTLSYTAASSDTSKATVSVSGAVVTITPVAAGSATVTVTASDGNLTATQTIAITVNPQPNRAPTAIGTILPITLTAAGSATNVNVSPYFSDPDKDTLSYTAVSSDTTKATVSVSSATVTITPKTIGSATVTVTARDPDGLTATQTFAVTVSSAPNRAPTAIGTIDPVILTAGASPANVNVSSKFSDPDNDTLTHTAVSSDTSKATVSVFSSIVTITPVAEGSSTVTVTARDPNGLTATQTIAVLVTAAPNHAPAAVGTINPVTLTVGAGSTIVNVLGNFRDPDNDTLTYTAISSDTTKATVTGAGSIVIIAPVAAGSTTVIVTASDGSLSATQTIAVTVNPDTPNTPNNGENGGNNGENNGENNEGASGAAALQANRAPTAVGAVPPITLTVGDSAQTVNLSIYFSDPDGDTLTYIAVSSDTSKATVNASGAIITITPVAEGTTTITVMAQDPAGLTATQAIVASVNSAPNRPPTAVGAITPVTLTAGADTATVDVSPYFSDPDGDTLTYTALSTDTRVATVTALNTTLIITPVTEGTATIMVTARDSEGLTINQTIVVTVKPIPNRAPVAVGTITPRTLTAGDTAQTVDVSPYFSDPDGDTLTYTAVSTDTRVVTVIASSSTLVITPGEAGTTTIMVMARDPEGLTIDQSIVVTVKPIPNRAPVAVGTITPVTLTVGEGATTVDISPYFSDPDGDTLTYTAISTDIGVVTVALSNTTLIITPAAEGATTVAVTASDGSLTATQNIPVILNPAPNRAPVPVEMIPTVTLIADDSAKTVSVSPYFSDPDGDTLTYTALSTDTGVVTVALSNAALTINPVAIGATTVTVTASDGNLTAIQNIPVLVTQPNRAPTAVGTVSPVTLTVGDNAITVDIANHFLDPAGDVLTYSAESSDTAVVTVSAANSTIIITPIGEGVTTIIVTARDSEGLAAFQTIDITVVPVPNRAPVPVGMLDPITLTAGDGSTTVGMADKFFDPDGDSLTYTAVSSNTAVATVSVSSATLTITPVAEGTATVMLIVKDTHGLTVTRNFTVMVNPAPNRAPVVARTVDPVTLTAGNNAAAIDIADKFSDPDGDTLTYTAVSANTAVVTVNMTNSTLGITPVATGSTMVILTASDRSLNTTQTFAVTVKPAINRAPIAVGTVNPVTLTAGDSSITMNMADKFSDPDGDALTYTAVSANTAVVTVNMTNSTLGITPVTEGATTVMVVVQDTDGLTITRSIAVTVLPAPNRAPTALRTIDPITLTVGDEDETVELSNHFSDPDGDALTYTAASSDATKATVSVSNAILGISPVAEGATTVLVIVQDTDGLTVTQSITVTVLPIPNRPPVVGTVEPIILVLGDDNQTVDLSTRFSDPDGDDLTYSAQSADTNVATVVVENATLKLTPIVEGVTTVAITVQDTDGLTITENITVVVNAAPNTLPTFTSATAFSVIENITTVGTVTAVDTDDEDSVTGYTVTGGADSAKFGVDPLSGELSFNTAPDFENPGDAAGTNQYTVVVGASSGGGDRALTAEQTITVTVTDGNDAPLAVGTIDPVTFAVGDEDQTVDVSDKFSDPDGNPLTYSAQSADTTVAQVTVEASIVTITPVEEGTTTVTVTALDSGSLTATQPINVTVIVDSGVNAAGSLARLDATISAVLNSTGFMNVKSSWTVANGDTLMLAVNVGFEGLAVTADISELDSTQSLVSLTPDKNGVYSVEISISEDNTALNGLKHILVTAKDEVGNSTQLIITSTLNNRYVTELLPNYPNPFNPETWIPYRLGKAARVVMTIYDAHGGVVRRFDLGYQPAGAYETRSRAVYWDGTNDFGETVANGVYFYSLSTSDYSRTRKAIILK